MIVRPLEYRLANTVVSSGSAEKILCQALVPIGSFGVGAQAHGRIIGVSSSVGTLTFRLRIGGAGTTSDQQVWASVASAAQVANQRAGMEFWMTVRQGGVSGICQAEGEARAGALTLPSVVAAVQTYPFNTTVAQYISMTVVCTNGTFTAHQGFIETYGI